MHAKSRAGIKVEQGIECLWGPEELAHYLRLKNVNSIGNMVRAGRITPADGMVKVGRLMRFRKQVVLARVACGVFGQGLDADGHPINSGNGNGEPHNG